MIGVNRKPSLSTLTSQDVIRYCHHQNLTSGRVRELAPHAYCNHFKNAPDCVALFIPGDQFLSAALDMDR